MNDMGAPPAWSSPEQFDPMQAPDQHDFGLIDFDIDLDFTFPSQDPADANQQLGQLADDLDVQHLHNPFSPHDARHGPAQVPQQQQRQQQQQQQQQQQRPPRQSTPQQPAQSIPSAGHNYFDFSMPPYAQGQPAFSHPQQHLYRNHGAIPPTPNSIEMHADAARYMHQLDSQAMFEARFQLRKDDMVHDTTASGAYFSPLSSPALNAQSHGQHGHASHYATSGSSTGASPVDHDVDMLDKAAQSSEQGRKLRSASKRSMPRSSAPSARIRQSPIVKPGRRKTTLSGPMPPKEVADLVEQARAGRSHHTKGDARHSREGSDLDSISPEPLSEMGPPPKPGSVTPSPALLAQNHQQQQQQQQQQAPGEGVVPATPASLMRILPSPTFGMADVPPMLDDLALPEASLEQRPPLARIDTAIQKGSDDTPRLSARKTPKLGMTSTPSASAAKASPMLSALSSPLSPAFGSGVNGRRDKGARTSKKRNSVSSNLVSPALRPKISPSIKPLLPDGGVSDDTHALLLASKSNYQNILDGTTVPGVIYPTSLSTNLTSKRTSHKIAEQGRRNRINTALQEMQELLPSPGLSGKESKSPESSAAQSSNSKAAKVESAIDYIKQLQQQCRDKDRLLDQKEFEMAALRRELAALRQPGAAGMSAGEQAAEGAGQATAAMTAAAATAANPSQENGT